MPDNVDYRLLERIRARRRLNDRPQTPPPAQRRAAAAAAPPHRLPAIDLRD
jgi:hypothetical protein